MVTTFVLGTVEETAALLDRKRLNKQITEAKQIINAIATNTKGYANHPAVLMWKGNLDALKVYHNKMLRYWIETGGGGTRQEEEVDEENASWPWWWGWEELILTHKLNLYRKDPDFYQKFNLTDYEMSLLTSVGYIWPSKVLDKFGSPEVCLTKGIFDLCSPLGEGTPAQYLWSREDVERWKLNRERNPRTNRKISKTAKNGPYKRLEKAEKWYNLH